MFDLQDNYLNKYEPWSGILEATAFSVHSTYQNHVTSPS